ncbi:MAG TPA: hypothetical protein VN829_03525 [Dongiaceae bacterium]|nr:hypothetical protein [Dongiaceae bacterium]
MQHIPARRGGLGFVILEQAEAGTDDLGFIVEAAAGNKTIDQFLEMGRNHFAHAGRTLPLFQTVVDQSGDAGSFA